MRYFIDFFTNRLVIVPILAMVLAQVAKGIIILLMPSREKNLSVILKTGGMPSSHSALVMALIAGAGKTLGTASPIFAVCVVFGMIVMYDAAGMRFATGENAKAFNMLVDYLDDTDDQIDFPKLKEVLGHKPVEVLAGAVLGFVIGILFV